MQQKTWIWIIIAVIVIAAAGFFAYQNGGAAGLASLGNTSLRTLLSSNSPQKCTFDNGQSSGTIYVSAGRMRGDFSAKNGGTNAQSHMVITNDIAYVWIDGMSQGYRMPFEDLTATSSNKNSQGIDADARVATNCGSWSSTDSVFALPDNVNFNAVGAAAGDMSPVVPSGSQSGTGASASASTSAQAPQSYYAQQCAACGAITDPTAKAQCIASFDCPSK